MWRYKAWYVDDTDHIYHKFTKCPALNDMDMNFLIFVIMFFKLLYHFTDAENWDQKRGTNLLTVII